MDGWVWLSRRAWAVKSSPLLEGGRGQRGGLEGEEMEGKGGGRGLVKGEKEERGKGEKW